MLACKPHPPLPPRPLALPQHPDVFVARFQPDLEIRVRPVPRQPIGLPRRREEAERFARWGRGRVVRECGDVGRGEFGEDGGVGGGGGGVGGETGNELCGERGVDVE